MLTKIIIIGIVLVLAFGLYSCNTYKVIDKVKSDNYYYNFFKTEVHYIPMGNSFELGNDKLDSLDIKTVEVLASNYLKDKSHVYFKSVKIKNADVHSFEILCANKGSFAKDKNRVYFESHSFKDLDVASFAFAGSTCGSTVKDKEHVYSTYTAHSFSEGNLVIAPIPHAHAATYEYLNDAYGKDDSVVYYKGKAIAQADAPTFTLMKDYYAKDRNTVYYDGLVVKGLDAATFVLIEGGGYAKDKNGVYFGLDASNGEDGNPLYYVARIVTGADAETFTMVKGEKFDYAKDKTSYYWGGKKQ
ncbi:MAG: hypothetical protein JWO58_219 [Chitinophagaceae bacterium]|nr:hypothetical protein [Chitinophagaceae bacterium]